MHKKELRSCPFCGKDDLKVHESTNRSRTGEPLYPIERRWFVSCKGNCFFAGPPSSIGRDDAVEIWNSRKKESNKEIDNDSNTRVDECCYNYSKKEKCSCYWCTV